MGIRESSDSDDRTRVVKGPFKRGGSGDDGGSGGSGGGMGIRESSDSDDRTRVVKGQVKRGGSGDDGGSGGGGGGDGHPGIEPGRHRDTEASFVYVLSVTNHKYN
jgi:hypothetical protein